MAARPTTPASPKNVNKVKPPVSGVPMYGCGMLASPLTSYPRAVFRPPDHTFSDTCTDHIQRLLTQSQELMNTCVNHYKMSLRTIFDNTPIVPQTSKTAEGRAATNLTSTYLCLQCPTTVSEEDRLKHGSKKQHRFCSSSPHALSL